MKSLPLALLLLGFASVACRAQTGGTPTRVFDGYVTSIQSPHQFTVDQTHVTLSQNTALYGNQAATMKVRIAKGLTPVHYGEHVVVTGVSYDDATVTASSVVANEEDAGKVSGFAVVDAENANTLWSDGYPLHITSETKITAKAPYTAAPANPVGTWIAYVGEWQPDGTVALATLVYVPNPKTPAEKKLGQAFEAKLTPPDFAHNKPGFYKAPGIASTATKGVKVTLLSDNAIEDRVRNIGERLIPAWEKALPADSPEKINFRFYVTDNKGLRTTYAAPNGVIVISEDCLNRMKSDDELASVLAISIADVMERMEFTVGHRLQRADNLFWTGYLMNTPLFSPVLGLAGSALEIGAMVHERNLLRAATRKSERVGMAYLYTAGFDVKQAADACRLDSTKKPKPLDQINYPWQCGYMIGLSGTMYAGTNAPPKSVAGLRAQ